MKLLAKIVLESVRERKKALVKTNYCRWHELSVSCGQNSTAPEVFQSCNKVKIL
jgi:hypothetical protein